MAAPVLTGEQLWVDGGGDGYCILVGSASVRVELIILMSIHAGGKPGKQKKKSFALKIKLNTRKRTKDNFDEAFRHQGIGGSVLTAKRKSITFDNHETLQRATLHHPLFCFIFNANDCISNR